MNRRLQFVNLFGVLALAALCVLQWQRDRRLNLRVNQLEQTRTELRQRLAGQEEAARGLAEDLARFKGQFKTTRDELDETRQKLRRSEVESAELAAERDQLRESVTNWAKAVQERDALIQEANDRIQGLSGELNASIRKFNELVTNYSAVVTDLNAARKATDATHHP